MKISDFNLNREENNDLFLNFGMDSDVEKNIMKLENDIEKDMFKQFNKNIEM